MPEEMFVRMNPDPRRPAPPYRLAVGTCNACPAPVYWLISVTTRKRAPIDAAPDAERGNCLVDDVTGMYTVVATEGERALYRRQGKALHINHFVTCPAAKRFRDQKAKKGPRP